ncbi:MAG: hypothetical protein HC888_12015 [Candidatus Competibacteraceae bacterium]|nr:hypothetical protein [Candidatus Competibacteraceae bacterium]
MAGVAVFRQDGMDVFDKVDGAINRRREPAGASAVTAPTPNTIETAAIHTRQIMPKSFLLRVTPRPSTSGRTPLAAKAPQRPE